MTDPPAAVTATRATWSRRLTVLALWTALVVPGIVERPLLVIDETRYVSVAWEMWNGASQLVPHLNGQPYSDKPPLLFWLMELGWRVFGVSAWWPRLVPPLFGLGCAFLTGRLARALWPGEPRVATLAPVVLLGSTLWAVYTTLTLFDTLLGFFVLLALLGVLEVDRGGSRARATLLVVLGVGGGILSKGPVTLLHLAGPVLLAPLWRARDGPGPIVPLSVFFRRVGVAVLLGIVIGLLWAVPAALTGGSSYATDLLWGQTAGRVTHAFAHRRPVWWYLPLLPLLLFPWSVWPPLLRCLRTAPFRADGGLRFAALWLGWVVLAFSLVSGKQVHYLLPVLPAFALLATRRVLSADVPARRWDHLPPALSLLFFGLVLVAAPAQAGRGAPAWAAGIRPGWGPLVLGSGALLLAVPVRERRRAIQALAAATVVLLSAGHFGVGPALEPLYDVETVARMLGASEREGHPIGVVGRYQGEFGFLGRLRKPIEVVPVGAADDWIAAHPGGRLVERFPREIPSGREPPEYAQPYGGGWITIRGRAQAGAR